METITISKTEYEEYLNQKDKINELQQRVDFLMAQMRLARHKQFGSSSEKSEYDQLSLFDEAEVYADSMKPEPEITEVMAHYRKKAAESNLKTRLVRQTVLHADETTLQVLHEEGKKPQSKSYMWLYRTSGDAESQIVLYEYQPDRKAEHPKEFLKDFHGYLHADGYSGYHCLPDTITVVGCWAHARRKFDEVLKGMSATG